MRIATIMAFSVASTLAFQASFADEPVLEEIIVTAQKRSESLQDVPISMEVVSGDMIDQYEIRDLETLQNYVPNLLIQPSPGSHAIYIRGFGSQATNFGTEQSVSMYVDGIYSGKARQFMAPFFDVERIEVLRGPQGALLGKNTAAGAISVVTAGPTDDFQGSMTGSYNFDRDGHDLEGYISGPISETVGGRVAFKITDLDGYIDNRSSAPGAVDSPELDNRLIRGSLEIAPTDWVDVSAKIEYSDFEAAGNTQVQVNPFVDDDLDDEKDAGPALGVPEGDSQESLNLSLTSQLSLSDHALEFITGYSSFDNERIAGGGAGDPENWQSGFDEEFDQWSQEVRLLSPVGRSFEYVTGIYYDRADWRHVNSSQYVGFLGIPTFTGAVHQMFNQDSTTWSAFAAGTWHANDVWRLKASTRYTRNEKEGDFEFVVDSGMPLGAPFELSGDISESNVDPSIAVQFDAWPNTMLYLSFSEGSKSGGFVAARTANAGNFTFADERARNYELGFKSTLFEDRLMLNGTLYYLEFSDLQVSTYDPTLPGFVSGNAAEATSSGVEAQAIWQVVPAVRFSASVAYLDAEYDDFPGAQCPSAVQGTPACDPVTNTTNLAGETITGASKWTGNIELSFEQPIGNQYLLGASVLGYYRSEFTTATDWNPVYGVQDSYDKWDARLSVGTESGSWEVALIGKNLTDELTQNFSYLWPGSPPPVGVQYLNEPRTIALQGTVRF